MLLAGENEIDQVLHYFKETNNMKILKCKPRHLVGLLVSFYILHGIQNAKLAILSNHSRKILQYELLIKFIKLAF